MSHRPSFNDELHRRLDGDEEVELTVPVLRSFVDQVKAFASHRGWDEPMAL